jgi:hypothetical protein
MRKPEIFGKKLEKIFSRFAPKFKNFGKKFRAKDCPPFRWKKYLNK